MTQTSQMKRSDKLIPWYIVVFFVAQTVLFGWFIYIANTTYTGLVTEQAYEKGLAYNRTIESEQLQEALGYVSAIEHTKSGIIFTLKDETGSPATGAKTMLWFYRPADGGADIKLGMQEQAPGKYVASLPQLQRGLWEIRIHAQTAKGPYQAIQRTVLE